MRIFLFSEEIPVCLRGSFERRDEKVQRRYGSACESRAQGRLDQVRHSLCILIKIHVVNARSIGVSSSDTNSAPIPCRAKIFAEHVTLSFLIG